MNNLDVLLNNNTLVSSALPSNALSRFRILQG